MKNVADIYPLTPTQAGILYHTLRAPQSELYFEQISCTLHGPLDVDRLQRAWDEIVARHPALRTIFLWEGVDEPLQVVRQTVTIPWELADWRDSPPATHARRLETLQRDQRQRGFDLTQAPLLRLILVRLADDRHHFIWNFHHLLTDGWSTHLVFTEAFAVYEALVRGERPALPPARPFRDYIAWLKQQNVAAAEQYWRQMLAGFDTPTPLQVDRPAPETAVSYGDTSLALSAETTTALKTLAQQHRLTLNTVVQGAWALLLSRYSGEDDVVFGVTLSGRPAELPGVEQMVGMFINTLPLRLVVPDDDAVLPWLERVQAQQMALQPVAFSPLAQVQGWSDAPPGQALFDTIVVFENYPVSAETNRTLRIDDLRYREQSNYPLALLVVPGAQIELIAVYNRRRLDDDVVERLLGHLRTLLTAMAANPEQTLGQLSLLDSAETQQLLVDWNQTVTSVGPPVHLHEQIAAVAAAHPDKTAVIAADHTMAYGELNARANQLAHHLRRRGVRPGDPVGLYVDRSAAMIVGILGIHKAGGAYVPLDPAYPAERIRFILADANPAAVLTHSATHLRNNLAATNSQFPIHNSQLTIDLDTAWPTIATEPTTNPTSQIPNPKSSPLAYIIYTSGSTGKPKGVMVTQHNLFHSTAARRHYYDAPVGRYLLLSSFAFDSSVAGIFWALADGGALVLPAPGEERDVDRLAQLIDQEQVTHTLALPSLYRILLDEAPAGSLDSLRTVIVAGEACPPDLSAHHFARLPRTALYNEYGPTEATVWASVHRLTSADEPGPVPIGRPIANTQLYIVDRQGRPAPIGVPGELVIGGDGVTPGYLNRPDLTAETFVSVSDLGFGIAEPARSAIVDPKLYRSGDLARWRPDGSVEFLGRVDDQVKIRGYRIELGEIEAVLQAHALIDEVAVIAHPVQGELQLVAYVVAPGTMRPTSSELRAHAQSQLPAYMTPSSVVFVEALPKTPNGKLDRRALPDPALSAHALVDATVAPTSGTEHTVAAIWADLLGLDTVSVHGDFFELGGHSLLATQLVSRLRRAFERDLPLAVVLEERTVAGQAERIDTLLWASSGAGDVVDEEREEFEF